MLPLDYIDKIIKETHMTKSNIPSIPGHFSQITDQRKQNRRHKLIDILTIAICGVICNADSYEHIVEFGKAKYDEFVKSPKTVMPHLIRHPELVEITGFRLSSE